MRVAVRRRPDGAMMDPVLGLPASSSDEASLAHDENSERSARRMRLEIGYSRGVFSSSKSHCNSAAQDVCEIERRICWAKSTCLRLQTPKFGHSNPFLNAKERVLEEKRLVLKETNSDRKKLEG